MRLSLHQSIALGWLFCSGWVFAPVLVLSPVEDAGAMLGTGIAIVTLMIAGVPLLLRWPTFKRWFCWTDAMSPEQRRALEQRELRRYYRIAFENGYSDRLIPYLWRILAAVVVLMAIEQEVGQRADTTLTKAAAVFLSWYPFGAVLGGLASAPLARMLLRRLNIER